MRFRVRKPLARHRALHHWHKWFAWRPVRVPIKGRMSNMTMVWFETIYRKGKYDGDMYGNWWNWEYKFK
jgi:hypothetical protein